MTSPDERRRRLALQERLARARLRRRPRRRHLRRADRAALRSFQRDYGLLVATASAARPPCARCASSAARSPAAARVLLREQELLRQAGPAPARQADRHRPRPRRRRPRHRGRRRRRGRPDVGPRPPAGRAGWRPPGWTRCCPGGPDTCPAEPSEPPSPTTPAPTWCSPCTPTPTAAARPRRRDLPLRHRLRRHLHRRRGARRVHPARADRPHRDARLPHPRQDLGAAAADPDARRPHRARLPVQPRGPPHDCWTRRSATSSPRASSSPSSGSTCWARTISPPARSPSPTCWLASWNAAHKPSDPGSGAENHDVRQPGACNTHHWPIAPGWSSQAASVAYSAPCTPL